MTINQIIGVQQKETIKKFMRRHKRHIEAQYDAGQLRAPKGVPEGGQWATWEAHVNHHLRVLNPEGRANLINAIAIRYQQPFRVISVVDKIGDTKEVVIELKTGIRKRITVQPNGHVHIQKNA
jgi:hypothetical protein